MSDDQRFMQRAVELARQGEGHVEPNPQVGCVLVKAGQIVGEGWHQKYGGPHAEANALTAAGSAAKGSTAYVTLEPCCHTGKTPPCADALIKAGVQRVVIAVADPFPQVAGGGIARLEEAGIACEVGPSEIENEVVAARHMLAPYLRLVEQGRPWVIAKWAMTLDGKIATRSGSSQWISSPESRAIGHQIRSRVDAVLVGRRTALADDPTLTARLENDEALPRIATRIVLGEPLPDGKLIQTLDQAPLLVVVRSDAEKKEAAWVTDAGGELLVIEAETNRKRLTLLMQELGQRRMANVLLEGGAGVLGAAFDAQVVDEVHAFIAPKIVGGQPAPSPIGGEGIDQMSLATQLAEVELKQVSGDVYLTGRINR